MEPQTHYIFTQYKTPKPHAFDFVHNLLTDPNNIIAVCYDYNRKIFGL